MVGIATSPSGFNNCHRHFPELLEAVKRGVLAAGGLPLDFPTISLGEVFLHPTSLMYRNLMAMDVEEMIRAQPMNAVVLMGGCDKTVPAQFPERPACPVRRRRCSGRIRLREVKFGPPVPLRARSSAV